MVGFRRVEGQHLETVVQEGVVELPLPQMTNPVTGEPGLRARFLDADGTELFAEDRRSSALVWFGGDAPIGRSAAVELATRFTPAESGARATACCASCTASGNRLPARNTPAFCA